MEPRLRLSRESIALSASVLRQLTLAAIALLSGLRLFTHVAGSSMVQAPYLSEVLLSSLELILPDPHLRPPVPQVLFTRTRGLWIARISLVLQALFYLILPVTLLLGLLLSIAARLSPRTPRKKNIPLRRWMRCLRLAKRRESSKSPTAS